MDSNHIFIQVIGFVGTVLFFVSFQCKNNKNLFRVQFLSYLFYTIHLILLGAPKKRDVCLYLSPTDRSTIFHMVWLDINSSCCGKYCNDNWRIYTQCT